MYICMFFLSGMYYVYSISCSFKVLGKANSPIDNNKSKENQPLTVKLC